MKFAPIALFVYSRFEHTKRTVDALLKNILVEESDLFIFSDSDKNPSTADAVQEVRAYIKTIVGFKSVSIVERDRNLGLANSIIDGVTQLCNQYGRVVVLEDDMVTSPYFLIYMNEALDRYEKDERVISIHGYVYPVAPSLPEAFFLRGADCWGWATWQRGWAHFNPDGKALLHELKHRKLLRAFDFDGSYPYSKMLEAQIKGTNDSWAVRWYASAYLANKLTLYPGRSLVHNIGNDSSGTHCGDSNAYDSELGTKRLNLSQVLVAPSSEGRAAFVSFFRRTRLGRTDRMLLRAKQILSKFMT